MPSSLEGLDDFTSCRVNFEVRAYDAPVWPLFSNTWTILNEVKAIVEKYELELDGWDLYKTEGLQRYYVGTIETEEEYHRTRSGKH